MESADMTVTLSNGRVRVNNTIRGRTYTVMRGDNLYKIARKVYGDGARCQELYEKNTATLTHPCLLEAGMVLYL